MSSIESDWKIEHELLDWSSLMMDLHQLHIGGNEVVVNASARQPRESDAHEFKVTNSDIKRVRASQIDVLQILIPNSTHKSVKDKNAYLQTKMKESKVTTYPPIYTS